MADRPILFSAPMVRSLLTGQKTQTRRILKSPWREAPIQNLKEYGLPGANYSGRFNDPHSWGWPFMEEGSDMPLAIWPELWGYKIGDRLWVRETFFGGTPGCANICYKADCTNALVPLRWKPGIHMPRSASRITLTVTDVRVQRLNDISESDARAEGVDELDGILEEESLCICAKQMGIPATESRVWFRTFWTNLHGVGSWDINPWVVALTFTAESRNIDA